MERTIHVSLLIVSQEVNAPKLNTFHQEHRDQRSPIPIATFPFPSHASFCSQPPWCHGHSRTGRLRPLRKRAPGELDGSRRHVGHPRAADRGGDEWTWKRGSGRLFLFGGVLAGVRFSEKNVFGVQNKDHLVTARDAPSAWTNRLTTSSPMFGWLSSRNIIAMGFQ